MQDIGNIVWYSMNKFKIMASIYLFIMSLLYIFDITLFNSNRYIQIIIGLVGCVCIYIVNVSTKKY